MKTSDLSLNLLLLLLVPAIGLMGLLLGKTDIGLMDVWRGLSSEGDNGLAIIVYELRLPRVLLAIITGAALGLSGAALQGLLKNPLAEPGVIGVSSSAALGAVVAIYFGVANASNLVVPLFAMAGALMATLVLYLVAMRDASVLTLILVGVAVNALAGALTSLALNLSPNPFAMADIMLWLLGSLQNRSMNEVYMSLPFVILGGGLLFYHGRSLVALSLGDDVAQTMGVSVQSLRAGIILGASLAVGASVAAVGAVGFVGLVVPHILRPLVGYDPKRLLLPSATGGAVLVLAADLAARLMSGGQELRLGVVTALIGAPFFLYLVIATRKNMR